MKYIHGESPAAKEARGAESRARVKAAHFARLEADLDARIKAKKYALSHTKPAPTYRPTPSMAEAWERFQATNKFPEPPEKGWRRLHAATKESAEHDARKRAA